MNAPTRTLSFSRRSMVAASAVLAGGAALAVAPGGGVAALRQATPVPTAGDIEAIAQQFMTDMDLRAVIVRVTQGGGEIANFALGESMTGVPATTDMHFRNGAVAISLVSTLMLILVDDGVFGLDDTIDAWLPELPGPTRSRCECWPT